METPANTTSPAAPSPCPQCGEWEVGADDNYCSACGKLAVGLELERDLAVIVTSLESTYRRPLELRHAGHRSLRVAARAENPHPAVGVEPEELELAPGETATLTWSLVPAEVPDALTQIPLRYRLIVDDDPRVALPVTVLLKSGPRPRARRISFGALAEGAVERRQLVVRNEGGTPLRLEAVEPQGSPQLAVDPMELPSQIEPGDQTSVPVVWDTTVDDEDARGPSDEIGFLCRFANAESLFVPARAALSRHRLDVSPPRVELAGGAEGFFQALVRLENRGTIDLEIEAIETDREWISLLGLEPPLALPAGGVGAGAASEDSAPAPDRRLIVRCDASELEPGEHEGRITLRMAGELDDLEIPVELRVVELEPYGEYIGIDFGTSNSVVALIDPETRVPTTIEVEDPDGGRTSLIPTVLAVLDGDGSHLVGHAAVQEIGRPPTRVLRSIKRIMGYDQGWEAFDRSYRPERLASWILRSLVAAAGSTLHRLAGKRYALRRAIVTAPSNFYDLRMQSILEACSLAAIEVDEAQPSRRDERVGAEINEGIVLDEPSAAALFFLYYLAEERNLGDEMHRLATGESGMHLLVFDYGGGTLDISIARVRALEDGSYGLLILATHGDNRIGGDRLDFLLMKDLLDEAQSLLPDFDRELIEASPAALERRRREEEWSPAAWEAVRDARRSWKDQAEKLKVQLSDERLADDTQSSVSLPSDALLHLDDGDVQRASQGLTISRSREQLETRLEHELDDGERLIHATLARAKLEAEQIDFVLHAGRQSLMPAVQRRVAAQFPRAAEAGQIVLEEGLLKLCVAKGAALYGRSRHQPAGAGQVRLLVSRTLPHAYGVDRPAGFNRIELEEVIAQGEDYPLEKVKTYARESLPATGSLRVGIYQNSGNGRQIAKNPQVQKIGEIEHRIDPTSEASLDLRFEVDVNRRLTVHAGDHPVDIHPPQLADDLDWMG